ncbi:hypothetical protein P691DRAFT_780671 [Macrolepiota fuliginosa MF-IS2]|uniref:Uncharacterized protein n=1 Tax=Macrolepiota fuliginosa MF-IS2 TaxID=1400762 RepID=A0A9P6C4E1_9AGAR|nr:hypothetical protein P691DRAFT_780671 [Macrolepiota fuliginosa MF-IS2]
MQRIASAVTLAVAALNAASSMALPMGSEEMDILERDFDDFADLEARDTGAWGEDLMARAGKPMVKPTHPAPAKTSAEPELNSTAPIIASGISAGQNSSSTGSASLPGVTGASSAHANGTVSGAPSKTVTKERTMTAKPTPCGAKGKGGKGKGKGGRGKKQPGRGVQPGGAKRPPMGPGPAIPNHSSSPPQKSGANGKNKRAATPIPRPPPKALSAAHSSGVGAGASSSLPHASASSEGENPEITPAPVASEAPGAHQATMTTVTRTGKDGVVTVNKVTFVKPTSCAEPQKPGSGAGGRKKKGGNGKKPNGGKKQGRGFPKLKGATVTKGTKAAPQGRGFPQLKGATVTKGTKAAPGKRELGWLDYMRRQSTSWVSGNREGDARREVGGEGDLFERSGFELDELD